MKIKKKMRLKDIPIEREKGPNSQSICGAEERKKERKRERKMEIEGNAEHPIISEYSYAYPPSAVGSTLFFFSPENSNLPQEQ